MNTPALLFPAISLVMLAFTNRFLALANVIRNLHDRYKNEQSEVLHGQIVNLRYRLRLIKNMQAFGVISFITCIICMYCIYIQHMQLAHISFAVALIAFMFSLILSLWEIQLSTKALELELSGMDQLEEASIVNYIKRKL